MGVQTRPRISLWCCSTWCRFALAPTQSGNVSVRPADMMTVARGLSVVSCIRAR